MAQYDIIGQTYAGRRRPDPRIAGLITTALGDASTLVNVGAGTGSYEPADRTVIAVEPSRVMIAQRPVGSAPVVQGCAERLPFADHQFDAALAVLTVHHWTDQRQGLAEMRRVSHRQVVLTWDPDHPKFWLVQDYFPEILETDRHIFPPLARYSDIFGGVEVREVPIPHDCLDGFLGAYWRRPDAYLDPEVRASISSFAHLQDLAPRLERLRSELQDGRWQSKNADLLGLEAYDLGYRLVVGGDAS
jgi:SAM-dependent methyltransferase